MGWMLPCRDHSLFEILRGAQIVGLALSDSQSQKIRFSAVDLYRNLPDFDLHKLRAEVATDGLFPHETRYLKLATDSAGFSETQPEVRARADELWPQLETGQVSDPGLAKWLRENGIDPRDQAAIRKLSQRISKPHIVALTLYTGSLHYLVNNVTRAHLFSGRTTTLPSQVAFDGKLRNVVRNYLDTLAGNASPPFQLPRLLQLLIHDDIEPITHYSPLSPPAQRWVAAARALAAANQRIGDLRSAGQQSELRTARREKRQANRDLDSAWDEIRPGIERVVPRLFQEMCWHADMAYDAISQLPTLGSPDRPLIVYRGDGITPVYSPIYGASWAPTGRAREYLSASRQLVTASDFMEDNPAKRDKVLVAYRLTGRYARDISIFSRYSAEQEVIFPPGSRFRRVEDPQLTEKIRRRLSITYHGKYEVIVMEEV
jgi:hypothetical protein